MMLRRLSLVLSLLMAAGMAPAQMKLIAAYAAVHQYESLRVSPDGKRLYGESRSWFGQALDAKTGQMIDAQTGPTPLLSLEDNEFINGETELNIWDASWTTLKRSFRTGIAGGEVSAVISEAKNRIFVARPKSGNIVAFDASGNYLKYLRRNSSTTIPMASPVKPFKNEKADQITVNRSVFGMTSLAFIGDLPGTLLAKSHDGSRYLCRSDANELVLVLASNLVTIWSRPLRSEGGTGSVIGFHNADFVEHDEFILVLSSEYTESGAPRTALLRFDLTGTQVAAPFYALPIADARARFAANPVSRRVYVTLPTTRFPDNPMRITILSYSIDGVIVKPYFSQITGRYDLKSPGRNRSEFEIFGQRAIDSLTGRDVERPAYGEGEIAADSRNRVNRSGQRLDFTNVTSGAEETYQVPAFAYPPLPIGVIDSFTAIWPTAVNPNGQFFDQLNVFRAKGPTIRHLGTVTGASVLAPGNNGHFATQDGSKVNVYRLGEKLTSVGSTPPFSNQMWATISAPDRLTVIAAIRKSGGAIGYDFFHYVYRINSNSLTEISQRWLAETVYFPMVVIRPDGARAAIYAADAENLNAIVLFDLLTGVPITTFSLGQFTEMSDMVFAGDSRLVVKTNFDSTLILSLPN